MYNQRFGIFLEGHSDFNNITWNYIEGNSRGIEVYSFSNNNFIGGNDVTKNDQEGFYPIECNGNYLIRKVILNNTAEGIYLYNCYESMISRNYLIGNNPNAIDNGAHNDWNGVYRGKKSLLIPRFLSEIGI